jgi:hypothetical protein
VGEVRGGEALDMLQAMNTGHEGSLSTAHANSPRDLLSRLETMALMSDVDLPVSHVREQIAGALDLIVHMTRLADGRRMVSRVAAVEGLRAGTVRTDDVFVWRRGPDPGFEATGVMPSVMHLLEERDERIDARIFGGLLRDGRRVTPVQATANGSQGSAGIATAPIGPLEGLPGEGLATDRSGGPVARASWLPHSVRSPVWAGSLRRLGSILE